MDYVYVTLSFITSFASILLIFAFKNDFKKLTLFQKNSLSIIVVSGLAPTVIGFINGLLTNI